MNKFKSTVLNVEEIDVNLADNVRLPETYNLKSLVKDIASAGAVLEPIKVEKLKDGKYHLIAGFRRMSAVQQINQGLDADVNKEIKEEIAEENLPFNPILQVPALVYEGLDAQAREILRCDHNSFKGLNVFEQYRSVQRLTATGLSRQAIAARLNQSPGWVQERQYLAKVSAKAPWIEEEFKKKSLGENNKAPTFAEVRSLNTLLEKGDEEAFETSVTKLSEGKAPNDGPKMKTKTQIKTTLEICNHPLVVETLKWVLGENDATLTDHNTKKREG